MAKASGKFDGTYGSIEFAIFDSNRLEVTVIGTGSRIRIRKSFDPRSWIVAFRLLDGHGFAFTDEGAVRMETTRIGEFITLEAQQAPETQPGYPLKIILNLGTAVEILAWLRDNAPPH